MRPHGFLASSATTMASSMALAVANVALLASVGRTDGTGATGEFVLAVTTAQLVASVVSLQLGTTVVYFSQETDRDVVAHGSRSILARAILAAAPATLLITLALDVGAWTAAWATVGTVFVLATRTTEGFLRADRRWATAAGGRWAQALAVGGVAAFVVAGSGGWDSAGSAVCGWAFAHLAFISAGHRSLPRDFTPDASVTRAMVRFGWRGHIGFVAQQGNYRADLFLVGALMTATDVGLYGTAGRGLDLLWYIPAAVSFDLLPQLVSGLRRTATRSARLTGVAVGVAALVAWYASGPAVRIVLGPEFSPSADLFRIMLGGAAILSVGKIYAQELISLGRPELNSALAVGALVVSVVGNLIVIPRYGLVGVASLASVVYGVQGLGTILLVRRARRSTTERLPT